jgi:hypothetical protein
MVKQGIIPIQQGQATYQLPANFIDTLDVMPANTIQQLGGNAFSSAGGSANGCFNPNSPSRCIQTSANGYISYNYGFAFQAINYIGIQTGTSGPANYHLLIEYSYDNVNWELAQDTGPQTYIPAQFNWFANTFLPQAVSWRIREVGGATLNIYQINFSTLNYNRYINRISREQYASIPNKTQQAAVSSYLINRDLQSTLILWPTPDSTYGCIIYNYKSYIDDVGYLDTSSVPQRVIDAIILELGKRLALRFAPERFAMLSDQASAAYAIAAQEDIEKVPLTISITDFSI